MQLSIEACQDEVSGKWAVMVSSGELGPMPIDMPLFETEEEALKWMGKEFGSPPGKLERKNG